MKDVSANRTDMMTEAAVIAITQQEDCLRAVCLQKQGAAFEVIWAKSSLLNQSSWRDFAAECGLPVGKTADGEQIAVAGFNSANVVFYRIDVPAVKQDELAAMVRLQSEARLPLPAEQIELAWRPTKQKDGQMTITAAAAKKEQLQRFIGDVGCFEPAKILLDCEGIVKVWKEVFGGNEQQAVVVSVGLSGTTVCLTEQARLINAVNLDMGTLDFTAADGATVQGEADERFARDIKGAIKLFGFQEPAKLPVYVLSDGSALMEEIVSHLVSAELSARAVLPQVQKLSADTRLTVEEIYEYRVPIGLGLMALDADGQELNVFERLYSPGGKEEKKRWSHSPKVTGALAAIMLALLIIVFCVIDVVSEKNWSGSEAKESLRQLIQRQRLMKTVAQQRPDLLKLLSEINASGGDGIKLDSFDFKKGQPVSIAGQAQNIEQVYEFQKKLLGQRDITEVKITNPAKDSKSGKLKFTINFHYRNFTKKRG